MSKWIISFSLMFIASIASAHQPDLSSTMLVEKENNTWVLQIRASLTAFQYEITYHNGEGSYSSPQEFKDLVLNHLINNTSITINGSETLQITNGQVKLGHETNVLFELSDIEKEINDVKIMNKSFADISRNQSALIILKKGHHNEQFILNEQNNHTAKILFGDTDMTVVLESRITSNQLFNYFMCSMVLASILAMIWLKTEKK